MATTQQKQRSLRSSYLTGTIGQLSEAELEKLGIDPNARPDTLGITAFALLANAVRGAGMRN